MNQQSNNEDLSLKLFVVLSKANRAVGDKVKKDIQSHGLNPTEFAVLELLYHKGEQPIQHIGEKVLLTSGSMTYVVNKLEEKKFILRKPCPNDRRVTFATITERGKALMDEIFPKHQRAIQDIFSTLDENEKVTMIRLLKQLGFSLQE